MAIKKEKEMSGGREKDDLDLKIEGAKVRGLLTDKRKKKRKQRY